MDRICAGGFTVIEAGLLLANVVPVDVLPETETRYGVGTLTFGPVT